MKRKKILVIIEWLSIFNIIISTLYLFWWDSNRWEPGLAEMMGIRFLLLPLFISEIFLIGSIICLKKLNKK